MRGGKLPLPFSLFIPSLLGPPEKQCAGYNPKLLGTQNPAKSQFARKKMANQRQSSNDTDIAIQRCQMIQRDICYTVVTEDLEDQREFLIYPVQEVPHWLEYISFLGTDAHS